MNQDVITGRSEKAAKAWKERAQELEEQLEERDQRLADIASIADPESGQLEERFNQLVAVLTGLMRMGLTAAGPMIPPEQKAELEQMLDRLKPEEEKPEMVTE